MNASASSPWSVVCFDLDGTICDTREGIFRSLEHTLRHLDVEHEGLDMRTMIGPPLQEIFTEHFGLEAQRLPLALQTYRAFYSDEALHINEPFAGMRQLLTALADGPAKLTVCTAKPWVYAERILERHSLLECFDFVSGPELDGSRRTKPEIIGHALAQIDDQPGEHALMIGDRDYDVKGARALGMPCVGVDWGFARHGELDAVEPAFRCAEVGELARLLGVG